jgi:energy-coupling factor transporter ATP-binding protein EcfA2
LPIYPQNTSVASIIEKLDSSVSVQQLPTEEDIREYATWGEDDDRELQELDRELANDPLILAEQRERCKVTCESVAREFDGIEATIGEKAVSDLQSKRATAAEARQAARTAALALPTELEQVGSDPWRKLFSYAKEYSVLAYPGVSPPATREGDRCVLCQQTLSPEAADRLRRFEEFVSGRASEEADEAQRAYEQAVTAIKSLVIPSDKSIEQRLNEYGEISPARKANQKAAIAYVADLAGRKAALIEAAEDGDFDRVRRLTLPTKPPLADEALTLAQETASLRAAAVEATARQKWISRRNELAARKQLRNELALVIERRNNLERWHKLKSCEAATRTREISTKVTELRRSLVTADLEQRIRAEIENLRLGHIPFKVRDASSRADSTIRIALDGALAAVNSHVLSEGEQRALALACFLADMAGVPSNDGIIVDDPVSSLDHIRLRTVAKRLVEEGACRQVIIFTHNLSFFREILDGAAEKQVPLVTHWVQHNAAKGFGCVSDNDEPWFAKKVRSRIPLLKKRQTALLDASGAGDEAYRLALKDFYSDLRETWERLVEELLLYGVVERLCTDVKTLKLKGVYVEDTDYRTIYWEMKRASEFSGHDMTASKTIALPGLDDVDKCIQTLEQYVEEVSTRRKKVEEQRKKLERAPEASFA